MNSGSNAPKAIVTGAAGFLGRRAARALADAGFAVAGLGHGWMSAEDCRATGLSRFYNASLTPHALNVAFGELGAPAVIFHAAGGASVSASWRDPEADRTKTLGATENLLSAVLKFAPATRLVFASSAAVYGEQAKQPIAETAALAPVSPYGEHKMLAEQACLESRNQGVDVRIIRFFSLYGTQLRKQILWDLTQRLAPNPAEIELGGIGDETRDFLHASDAARLIVQAATQKHGFPSIVNGGTGTATTVRQLAETVVSKCGARTRITFSGIRPKGDPTHLVADPSLARENGFHPAYELGNGIAEYVAWTRKPELTESK